MVCNTCLNKVAVADLPLCPNGCGLQVCSHNRKQGNHRCPTKNKRPQLEGATQAAGG